MGTHPTSPSRLVDGTALADHLAAHPSLVGGDIITQFDAIRGNIPFLFKILAIEKALSIQTHPDKETAERLHAEQPNIYKGNIIDFAHSTLYDLNAYVFRPQSQAGDGHCADTFHCSLYPVFAIF